MAQILGGLALLGSVYFLYQNVRATQKQIQTSIEAQQENQQVDRQREDLAREANRLSLESQLENQRANRERERLTQEANLAERFALAVEQLVSERLPVRLGAIFSLERLANDSEREHWTVMEVLAAYVRERAPRTHLNKENEHSSTGIRRRPPMSRRRSRLSGAARAVRTTETRSLDLRRTDLARRGSR